MLKSGTCSRLICLPLETLRQVTVDLVSERCREGVGCGGGCVTEVHPSKVEDKVGEAQKA